MFFFTFAAKRGNPLRISSSHNRSDLPFAWPRRGIGLFSKIRSQPSLYRFERQLHRPDNEVRTIFRTKVTTRWTRT